MTQEELEQLPIITDMVCLFTKDDDGVVCDAHGTDWLVGWLNGVRVRQVFGA